jgi:4-hydroxy-2-oxoheptanedioate aldolase
MGVKHFCIGWDVRILHDWWRTNGEGMRAILRDGRGGTAGGGVQSQAREGGGSY